MKFCHSEHREESFTSASNILHYVQDDSWDAQNDNAGVRDAIPDFVFDLSLNHK